MDAGPHIEVEATFLPYDQGGRVEVPVLKGARFERDDGESSDASPWIYPRL